MVFKKVAIYRLTIITVPKAKKTFSRRIFVIPYVTSLAMERHINYAVTVQYKCHRRHPHHQHFLPLLRKGTVKKVIIISSGMGDPDLVLSTGISNQAPYSISKAAVNMVVAKYAAEYKAEGFVFLALSPGLVDTLTKARESHSSTVTTELLLIRYPATPEEAETYRTILAIFKPWLPISRDLLPLRSLCRQCSKLSTSGL